MSATALLEGRGLRRRFGGVVALDGVDISLSGDEIVGIIGPNGSGKTTLFNVLSGFHDPSDGTVRWQGEDITRVSSHARARKGLVRTFQEAMVFPGMSVRENFETALCVRHLIGPTVYDVEALASYVQLDHVIDTLAGQLSWGQTRLLGIGLALAMEPTLLLLDEPFAGLSPVAAEQIGLILRKLKASGIAMAIIDHEMTYLLPVVDRLIVLVNGRKLAEGTPDEVIALAEVRKAYLGL